MFLLEHICAVKYLEVGGKVFTFCFISCNHLKIKHPGFSASARLTLKCVKKRAFIGVLCKKWSSSTTQTHDAELLQNLALQCCLQTADVIYLTGTNKKYTSSSSCLYSSSSSSSSATISSSCFIITST